MRDRDRFTFADALRQRDVLAVFVADGMADDVARRDIVSTALRAAAMQQLSTVFSGVAMAVRGGADDHPATVDEAVRRLGDPSLGLDAHTSESVSALYDTVDTLLDEVLDVHTEAGLETLRNHSDGAYQHAVDVAAIGALLGKRAGLSRLELRELALGCLLHDIGMIYLDTAVLDKREALTHAERRDVERHPYLGFELVRRMPMATIHPAHVAYQHHERQDATGYPRGLQGGNRVVRSTAEEFDGRRMLLVAEIAAVADVYSALTSDRAYRAALSHDVAADRLETMAGSQLNREVVDLFHRTVPRYPIGHWVVVRSGRWTGHRGVVTGVPVGRPDRPRVRLHIDDRDEELSSPVESRHRTTCPSSWPCATRP